MSTQYTYRIAFARYPAVRLAVLFAVGIVAGSVAGDTDTGGSVIPILYVEIGLLLLCGGLEVVHRRRMDPRLRRFSVFVYMLCVVGFGWFHFVNAEWSAAPDRDLERFVESSRWEQARYHGQIEALSFSDDRVSIMVSVDSVYWGDSLSFLRSFRMRVRKEIESQESPPTPRLGDYIVYRATVYPADPPRNPHQFDYPAYLEREGIAAVGGIDEILQLRAPVDRWNWIGVRRFVHRLIDLNFSNRHKPLAKAILIGDKSGLTERTSKAFSRSGLAHIMAVSGMHVGFLVAPFWLLIPWCWRFKWGKVAGMVGISGILVTYAGVTGFSASVVRASLMAVLLAYGKLCHRRRHSVNLTAAAALVLLAVDPRYLLDVGFQLSFAAVFTILLVWPLVSSRLGSGRFRRWWHGAAQLFLLSLLVQVGLLPLLARYFGEFSLVGPLMNMMVMVVVGLMIQWGLFCLAITAWQPSWGVLLNRPVDLLLGYMQRGVEWTGQLSWGWMEIEVHHPLWYVLWGLILLAAASSHMPRHRWKLWIMALGTMCIWQGDQLHRRWSSADLMKVTALDVGQGDALLVQTPSGKSMLIDAGRWSPDYNSGTRLILPYLEAEGVDTLHAVVLTHPHADHIGGMEAVLSHIPVGRIYHSGMKYDSKLFARIQNVAGERNVEMVTVQAGQRIPLEPAVRCYVLGPHPSVRRRGGNINDASVVVQLAYGDHKFLFMGDAEKRQEGRLVEQFGGYSETRKKQTLQWSGKPAGKREKRPAALLDEIAGKPGGRLPDPSLDSGDQRRKISADSSDPFPNRQGKRIAGSLAESLARRGEREARDYSDSNSEWLRSDYLKAGHHGSNTSSTRRLLKKVRPQVSVVSLAWKNRYRHPHSEAVRRLRKWTSHTLHFTSLDRAVIYESDGKKLRRVNWDNQQF